MTAAEVTPADMTAAESDERFMARALELAARGEGSVEPNPMVGCVLVRDGQIVGEGWHQEFGGPHAEIVALQQAGKEAVGATAYVTLEPCCHQGKTPPCTRALMLGQVARVVAAMEDPFPPVDGGGLNELRNAGIPCDVGILAAQSRTLNAPYLKRIETGRPWVIAKWAMSLDGKIATASGNSRWISNETSRAVAHQLRGRVDAIIVGSATARTDDPMLTARPKNPADVKRTPLRIVVDSTASLSLDSQLVQTARDVPVLVAVANDAPDDACAALTAEGVEVLRCPGDDRSERFEFLLEALGRRRLTNVLVEGGGRLLGTLFDMHAVDEVHVFIAPKILGGAQAPPPVAGAGVIRVGQALRLENAITTQLDGDTYIHGRVES